MCESSSRIDQSERFGGLAPGQVWCDLSVGEPMSSCSKILELPPARRDETSEPSARDREWWANQIYSNEKLVEDLATTLHVLNIE